MTGRKVGCEREDGTLNIHLEAETCEVCTSDPRIRNRISTLEREVEQYARQVGYENELQREIDSLKDQTRVRTGSVCMGCRQRDAWLEYRRNDIQFLINFLNSRGILEDGSFTFPDGETWEAE